FSLNYSSDRFRSTSTFSPKFFGLGGWTPDILHFYDEENQVVFYGDGESRPIAAVTQSSGYYLTNKSGTEIYFFDKNGRHIQTQDAVTGAILFIFSYNQDGTIASIKDQFGNTNSFSYSTSRVQITSPYGQKTTLNLDTNSNLIAVTNPNNETYNMTFDSLGFLLSFQKPGGQKSIISYDSNGFVNKDQGAGGDFISLLREFNAISKTQTITSNTALNRKTVYTTSATDSDSSSHFIYGADGSTSKFENSGKSVSSVKNSYEDLTNSVLSPDPRFGWMAPYQSSSNFSTPGNSVSISVQESQTATLAQPDNVLSLLTLSKTKTLQNDPNRVFSSTYDGQKKLWTYLTPLKRVSYQTLNPQGQLIKFQKGTLNPVVFSYDSRGRLSSTTQKDRKTIFAYDSFGNLGAMTDPLGGVTTYKYDKANRLIQKTLPTGNIIATTYDSNGNITSITPPGKTAHSFSYNLFELIGNYLPPNIAAKVSGATTYTYNLDQQLTQVNKPDGTSIKYTYDPITGYLNSILEGNNQYTIGYRQNSDHIQSITSPDQIAQGFYYDGSLPIHEITTGPVSNSLIYFYDDFGHVGKTVVSDTKGSSSTIPYYYDPDNALVVAGDEYLWRNELGNVSNIFLDNIYDNILYDDFGQVAEINPVNGTNGKDILSLKYTRDKLGRVVVLHESYNGKSNDYSYGFDVQGRLLIVAKNGAIIRSYLYDGNGNRTLMISTNGSVGGYANGTYDSQDRLIQYGTKKFTYNANGDLSGKIDGTNTTSYTYDAFGNLKSVILPNKKKIEYIVDGQNRRVGKKVDGKLVQAFIYQGQTQIIGELDGNGTLIKSFIYGSKSNSPDYMVYQGKSYKIISNHLGTPRLIADSSTGAVVQEFDFDEFGIPQVPISNPMIPFGFAGGLYDVDTGLVRFGARDYDAETGRWTSKDPILFAGKNAQLENYGIPNMPMETNLYSYSMQDPVNFIDPKGKTPYLTMCVPQVHGECLKKQIEKRNQKKQCGGKDSSLVNDIANGFSDSMNCMMQAASQCAQPFLDSNYAPALPDGI
ncbi:MAG TPA: RHS repeat-associated core domain-containing protein, partial [Bdellovibrio sp.]|nr:RHS repeat-associated core domain-containing protein [Bdellovibrio sp.]